MVIISMVQPDYAKAVQYYTMSLKIHDIAKKIAFWLNQENIIKRKA
jgi:hypothetical protein